MNWRDIPTTVYRLACASFPVVNLIYIRDGFTWGTCVTVEKPDDPDAFNLVELCQ